MDSSSYMNGSSPTDARFNGGRTLADSSPGDLVRVELVRVGVTMPRCGWMDRHVRPGETLQCVDDGEAGLMLARSDGTRLMIPHDCARSVGVRFFRDHLSVPVDASGDGSRDGSGDAAIL